MIHSHMILGYMSFHIWLVSEHCWCALSAWWHAVKIKPLLQT